MRGEIIRLVFSLCLIGGAFFAGVYTGWRKWGHRPDHDRPGTRFTVGQPSAAPRPGSAARTGPSARTVAAVRPGAAVATTHELRRDLFAPETEVLDLRQLPGALPRRGVVRSDRSLPRATIIADDFVTTRSEHDPRRVD